MLKAKRDALVNGEHFKHTKGKAFVLVKKDEEIEVINEKELLSSGLFEKVEIKEKVERKKYKSEV